MLSSEPTLDLALSAASTGISVTKFSGAAQDEYGESESIKTLQNKQSTKERTLGAMRGVVKRADLGLDAAEPHGIRLDHNGTAT
jgi:hypothetical protein